MPETVQCPVCQKSYAMKPELAGKRVQCKCGEKFTFPAVATAGAVVSAPAKGPPKKAPAVETGDAGEYDIAGEKKAAPVEDVPEGQCKGCRKPLLPGAVICTACGYNQKTGALIRTQVLNPVAPAPKKEKQPSVSEPLSGTDWLLIIFCNGIAFIMGLIRGIQGRGWNLLIASVIFNVVAGIIGFVIGFVMAMVKGSQ